VAARSEAQVCGRPLAGTAGSNHAGAQIFVSCEYCVLCLCDGPIPRPGKSYRVLVCVSLNVIKCNNHLIQRKRVDTRGQTKNNITLREVYKLLIFCARSFLQSSVISVSLALRPSKYSQYVFFPHTERSSFINVQHNKPTVSRVVIISSLRPLVDSIMSYRIPQTKRICCPASYYQLLNKNNVPCIVQSTQMQAGRGEIHRSIF
jgi:hypothetical protein